MQGRFENIKIQGICSAVPSYIESNQMYSAIQGERRVKKQIQLTGVNQRHISDRTQSASDLCFTAAERLIEHLQWKLNEIKVLIFVTQEPDFAVPSTAFFLQKRLRLPKDCICYDINLGCTAFNVGIQSVSSLMQMCSIGEKGLLLVGDTQKLKSPYIAYSPDVIAKDMLFGSAGSCTALEKVENHEICYCNYSDGDRYQAIFGRYGLASTMDGSAVFSFTINDVVASLNDFRNQFDLTEDKIDYYVFHQAQKLILDDLMQGCDIEPGRDLRSFQDYGNATGCSIPLSICANSEQLMGEKGIRLLLCGFGVGLSWGCIYTEIDAKNILPVVISDEFYEFRPESLSLFEMKMALIGADCDLGEWVTKYLIDCGAKPIICGNNRDRLVAISKAQYITTEFVDGSSLSDITEGINRSLKSTDDRIRALIVFGAECMSAEYTIELLQSLTSENDGIDSVVFVGNADNEKGLEITKSHLYQLLSSARDKVNACVNGIVYLKDSVNIVPIRDAGQKWYEEYVEKKCPENMAEASYIAKTIEYLISGAGCRTDNSILFVR